MQLLVRCFSVCSFSSSVRITSKIFDKILSRHQNLDEKIPCLQNELDMSDHGIFFFGVYDCYCENDACLPKFLIAQCPCIAYDKLKEQSKTKFWVSDTCLSKIVYCDPSVCRQNVVGSLWYYPRWETFCGKTDNFCSFLFSSRNRTLQLKN